MATSKTSIANKALIGLGQTRITDITENSNTARLCNEIFDQTADEALVDGPEDGWKFARQRQTVSVSETAPEFGYDYQFQKPINPYCLMVLEVQVGGEPITDWVEEDDYILTNLEDTEIDVVYIKRVENVAKYPPYFVRYLAVKLGVELAHSIVGNPALSEKMALLEQKVKIKAIALDNKGIYVEEENMDWIDAGR